MICHEDLFARKKPRQGSGNSQNLGTASVDGWKHMKNWKHVVQDSVETKACLLKLVAKINGPPSQLISIAMEEPCERTRQHRHDGSKMRKTNSDGWRTTFFPLEDLQITQGTPVVVFTAYNNRIGNAATAVTTYEQLSWCNVAGISCPGPNTTRFRDEHC